MRETVTNGTVEYGPGFTTFTGSKFTGHRPWADIAKDIRTDIRAAVKAGTIPAGHKISVKVAITAIYITIIEPTEGAYREVATPKDQRGRFRRVGQLYPTDEIAKVGKAVHDIASAYVKVTTDTRSMHRESTCPILTFVGTTAGNGTLI